MRGEGSRLKISGAIDLAVADELCEFLASCLDQDERIELDLSEVDDCETATLQVLYAARKTAERRGKPFRIAAGSSAVAETCSRLGLPVESLTFEPGLSK